jgi:hypothetical protein
MSFNHAVAISIDTIGADTDRVIRPAGTGRILRRMDTTIGKVGTWTELWLGFRCRWQWSDFRTPGVPSGTYGSILDGGYGQISWGICSGPACWGDNDIQHAVGIWGPEVATSPNSRALYSGAGYAVQPVWPTRWQNNVRALVSGNSYVYAPSTPDFRTFYITRIRRDDGANRTVIARCWPSNTAMATDQPFSTFLALMKQPTWLDLFNNRPANYTGESNVWNYFNPKIDEVSYGLLDHFYISAIKSYSFPIVSEVLIRVI